jgi:hypothetical protein
MKDAYVKMPWLIPVLGIALVAGGLIGAATYVELERKTHDAETSIATTVRLCHDLELCAVLRTLHQGDINSAARQLDLLLCNDIVAVNSRLASADTDDRAFVKNAFVRFSLVRPKSAELLADVTQELRGDQIEAENILARAGAGTKPGIGTVAVLP